MHKLMFCVEFFMPALVSTYRTFIEQNLKHNVLSTINKNTRVESAGIEPASYRCERYILPFNYDPARQIWKIVLPHIIAIF